ncbi:MAG: GNAT family N-acetyltransferase [Pseudomonadota bacterium]
MPETNAILLRDGIAGDFQAIADLHVASWQQTYRSLMPDTYLSGPVFEDLRKRWHAQLMDPPKDSILIVAEDETAIAGFIYLYPDEDEMGWVTLDNLHVRADFRGRGLGERLMKAAAARITELGRARVLLYVLDGNDDACRFYERLGGVPDPIEGHTIAGFENLPSIPYRWHDFSKVTG